MGDKMRVEWLGKVRRSLCGLTNGSRWTACRQRGGPRSGPSSCRRVRRRGPVPCFGARSPSSASGVAFPEAGQGMIGSARRSRTVGLGSARRGRCCAARCRSAPSGFSVVSPGPSAALLRRGWWQHSWGCRAGASTLPTRSCARRDGVARRGVGRKPRRDLEALLLHLLVVCRWRKGKVRLKGVGA